MTTTALVENLKNAGQDFEFYPTTREMVKTIWKHRFIVGGGHHADSFKEVLDIGCGTCNFNRWIKELNAEFDAQEERKREQSQTHYSTRNAPSIYRYYVMEKSRILLDRLEPSTIVLGTDFREATLIDKPVDTIFCNPPYSEYEDWAAKIITESVCKEIYLIIPRRWKESEKIKRALATIKLPYDRELKMPVEERVIKVIGSSDFQTGAERTARAKVDILYINKTHTPQDAGFDKFFNETFNMPDDTGDTYSIRYECTDKRAAYEALKYELSTGKNKIEILCNGYEAAQKQLLEHFKTLCALDAGILNTIGIEKAAVKKALKKQIEGLKNIYWQAAFDCLEAITTRLTSTTRREMLERFALLTRVDFTASNIYALVIWVIKNANRYTEKQMIDFFKAMSSAENVRNYKSNKKVFERSNWRYSQVEATHYTLDYRIVCTDYALPGEGGRSYADESYKPYKYADKIGDICTVAENLGFKVINTDLPNAYGDKGIVQFSNSKAKLETLFEFRIYKNGNVHVKFNIEFIKALNVVVAQKLGWIHKPEDIAREFTPEMAQGAKKYFNVFKGFSLESGAALMLPAADEPPAAPDTPEEPETPTAQDEPEAPETEQNREPDFIDGKLF